jgi:hypothetical protein
VSEINTAKGRAVIRERLGDLAVDYRVEAELGSLVDDKRREIYRAESQVREMLKLLGAPLGDGPFSIEAAERALAQLGEDGEHG